jgi:hypothetical protein
MNGQAGENDENEQQDLTRADTCRIRVNDPLVNFVNPPNDEKDWPIDAEPVEDLPPKPDE